MSITNTAISASNLKGVKSFASLLQSQDATYIQKEAFNNIRDSLKDLTPDKAVKNLNKLNLSPQLSAELMTAAKNGKLLKGSAEEINAAISTVGASGASNVSGFGSTIQKFVAVLKPFAPALITAGAAFAAFKAYQWADDKFVLSFDTALQHAQESNAAYSQTSQELETLNSKLQVTQARIDELKSKGPLTLIEQQELSTLEQQNTLLSAQAGVKRQLADEQKKQAAKDTKKALNYKSETVYEKDDNGNLKLGNDGDLVKKSVDRYDYIDDQIKSLKQAQQNIKNSEDELDTKPSGERKKQLEENIKNAKKHVSDYKQNILSTISSMNEEASAGFYLDDGTLLPGYEDDVKKLNEWTDKVAEATGGLSSKQKDSMNKLWENDSLAQAQQSIVSALRNGEDITVDSITAQFPGLAAACDAAGISVEGLLNELQILASQEGAATVLEQAFEATSSSIQKATDNLTTLNSLLKESTSGSGISADGVAAFREMFGENADSALEKTANGYHINQEALEGLQQQQGALLKSDYLSTLNDQYTQLQSIQEEIIAAYERLGQTIEGTSHSALDFFAVGREGCDSYRRHIPGGRQFNTNLVNSVLAENDLANFVLPMQSNTTAKQKVADYLYK